jgi:L-ascorbate metabolism protein UlaG (beta-lactamase superfamily)
MAASGIQVASGQQGAGVSFIRGDANGDGKRNITDAIFMLGCSFIGTGCPTCMDAADVNDDGQRNITDPIYLLNFLFAGGANPPAPDGACGQDPTADDLDCVSFPPCASGDIFSTSKGDVIITPIEHATLVLEWDQKTIYVDPVGGAAQFHDLPAPDIILVTDIHGDHMDPATLRAVARDTTALVIPMAVSDAIAGAGGFGSARRVVLANGETKTVEGIGIEAVPMYNTTPDRLKYHAKGRGNGYVLDLAGTRVYLSGDTEDIPEMRMLTAIDGAFLCMNLPFTMTPEQAASAVLEFKPKIVYPYHYRGQDPAKFKSLVEAASRDIEVRLRDWYPGQ